MGSDPFGFDNLAPVAIRFGYGGKTYVLKEASGDAAYKYRSAVLKAARPGPDGKMAFGEGLPDCEPLLLSLCLFSLLTDKDGNEQERPVPLPVVRSWPLRVIKPLIAKVREISELDEEEGAEQLEKRIEADTARLAALRNGEDPAKNGQSNSTGGSTSEESLAKGTFPR